MTCCCVPESHCFSYMGLLICCYVRGSYSHQHVPQQYEALNDCFGFVCPNEQWSATGTSVKSSWHGTGGSSLNFIQVQEIVYFGRHSGLCWRKFIEIIDLLFSLWARYKQKKELENKLASLRTFVESGQADEEQVRELYLLQAQKWITISFEEIESIDQEMVILKSRDTMKQVWNLSWSAGPANSAWLDLTIKTAVGKWTLVEFIRASYVLFFGS